MLSLSSIDWDVPIVASKLSIASGSRLDFLKLSIDITLSLLDNLSPLDAFNNAWCAKVILFLSIAFIISI